jgi:hypothetical protein
MEDVKYNAKQIHLSFSKVINFYHKLNKQNQRSSMSQSKTSSYIFVDNPPILSSSRNENIMHAILDGFYINLMKKNGNKYINCFPSKKTKASISMDSLYSQSKSQSKYALYSQLRFILGKTNYAIVSKLSPALIKEIEKDPIKNKYVMDCWNTMPEELEKEVKDHKFKKIKHKFKKGDKFKKFTNKFKKFRKRRI